MLSRTLFLLSLAVVGASGCDTSTEATGPIRVTGAVVNLSRGGEPMAGLPVVLYGDFSAAGPALLARATTDQEGRFELHATPREGSAGQLDLVVNVHRLHGGHLDPCSRPHAAGSCTVDPRYNGAVEPIGYLGTGYPPLRDAVRMELYEYTSLVLRATPSAPPPPSDTWLYFAGGWAPASVFGTSIDGFWASERDSVVVPAKAGAMNPVEIRAWTPTQSLLTVRDSVYCPVGVRTTYAVSY